MFRKSCPCCSTCPQVEIQPSTPRVLCQSCFDVCHWLCQCFLRVGSTGKASGTQPINECVTEHQADHHSKCREENSSTRASPRDPDARSSRMSQQIHQNLSTPHWHSEHPSAMITWFTHGIGNSLFETGEPTRILAQHRSLFQSV